ncbi:MAG: hypothetical protein H6709_10605 [Kofleriaceae bacterium]|nr:hypothetical protein [Kofleriaceae bacterium]MCB9572525.1 hypothetical protein [Kofleriaceae bacterium]
MRNERRTSGSGMGAAETCAGNRASAPRPHFHWRRWKGYWRGQYAEGHDPGLTYPRGSVEVATRVLPGDRALREEARLIRRLKPRDNLIGQPELEAAPF